MINKIILEKFTAFDRKVQIDLSPGINIIIGENGTGKTHLLKALYSLCYVPENTKKSEIDEVLTKKLIKVFRPEDNNLWELYNKGEQGYANIQIEMSKGETGLKTLEVEFYSNKTKTLNIKTDFDLKFFQNSPVFIPTKEAISFFKGFVSFYDKYDISFDETYRDICQSMDLPEVRKEKLSEKSKELIKIIETVCGGKFLFKGGTVKFKSDNNHELSIHLVAEGFKKLGMFSRLLETGVIDPEKTAPIFIDEPETNMNPKLLKLLVNILLELSRKHQQIIIATHDYVLLKWFDLLMDKSKEDKVRFHSLFHNPDRENTIEISSTDEYLDISPNPIDEAYASLIDEDIEKSMDGLGK